MSTETLIHYNNDVLFFQSFLDPYLKYGSGYFEEGDTFNSGAIKMLDKVIALGRVQDKSRVLDVGCGWGSFYRRLCDHGVFASYTGITPAVDQINYLQEYQKPKANFIQTVWEDFKASPESFDAIFFNDSICHIKDKETALQRSFDLLSADGTLVIQDTYFANSELYRQHKSRDVTRFVQSEIFGFAEILGIDSFVESASRCGFKVTFMEDVSKHYIRTVTHWMERLDSLDRGQFPLTDSFLRYLKIGIVGLDCTTVQYCIRLEKVDTSRRKLRNTLRKVR